jgi:hypothetical protein
MDGLGSQVMRLQVPELLFESRRPPGRFDALLYCRPCDTLVAVMAHTEPPARRLYFRRLPDTSYTPVTVQHELESQESAHCCEEAPLLIFNEMRFRKLDPDATSGYLQVLLKNKKATPQVWGADWLGIRRINLKTTEESRILDERSLKPPAPHTSGWVSEILSVSADGSRAVCVVGLGVGQMRYFVYELSFAHGLERMVAELPDAFL